MKVINNGKLILPHKIIEDGFVLFEGDTILWSGSSSEMRLPSGCEIIDANGNYIAPGFVDIHCHGGDGVWCETDPVLMARHHLTHGTTSLLCSIAYGFEFPEYIDAIQVIREAYEKGVPGNIAGIHMESPYISPYYGARSKDRAPYPIIREEYEAFVECSGNLIRQWTFSPELDCLDDFVDFATMKGIALAMGHSEAGVEAVDHFYRKGVRIVTHLFDATGCSIKQKKYGGTRDPWFDECCMVYDDMYVEIIPDSLGAHVRPTMAKLALKTMGEDFVCIITDASAQIIDGDGLDFHINEQGELAGSKMTMDRACRNMRRSTGADMRVVCKMASTNPAKAVGLFDEVGSLEAGKKANILIMDDDFTIQHLFLQGKDMNSRD
jgi:N-acetylglucosamine-6-phosphate deacetylase